MADQCQHDFVPICGQDSLGISRMFNDNCDLYEYNCDEKKRKFNEQVFIGLNFKTNLTLLK